MKNRILAVVTLVVLLLAVFPAALEAQTCKPTYHVVKAGQNLTQIARTYGVSVQAIVKANNLWNPNLIYPGQSLLIPVPCSTPPPSTQCSKIHVVKRGEYLKSIAARYGTTWTAIANLNNLGNPNLIYPGQRLKVPVACETPAPAPTTGPWTGKYWPNMYLSGDAKYTRHSKMVWFDWGTKGPGNGIGGTNFSARFTRQRYFDPGLYRFFAQADDGVRVWIDGVLIIDKWQDQPPTLYTADKQLSAGTHTMQVDYYQHAGAAQVKFWPERIDAKTAWQGEFFNNMNLQGDPVKTKSYNLIDFAWGKNAPLQGITADYFSARFTGKFYFVGGTYRFTATADDGIRIWVDGNKVLDKWHTSAATTYTVDVPLSEGDHDIKVEYFEEKGAAVCKLRWTQK